MPTVRRCRRCKDSTVITTTATALCVSRDDSTGPTRPLGMAWTADGTSLVTCGQTHKDSPPLVFWVKEASTGSFTNKR